MRRITPVVVFLIGASAFGADALRVVPNRAFGAGELFRYKLSWEFIEAGDATMSVFGPVSMNGRPCYHVVSEAKSSATFSLFFKVRDRIESWIDAAGIYPHRYEKHLEEGKFRDSRLVVFDHAVGTATTPKDVFEMPPFAQDALSVLYYFRTLDFGVGDSVDIENFTDRKVYPLRVIVHRREKVKVRAGTFDCFVCEPILRGPTIFEAKGTLLVWITADERHVPVLMRSAVVIGSVSAELIEYRFGTPIVSAQ